MLKYGSMWKLGEEICRVNDVVSMGQLGWVIYVKGPEGSKDMVEDVHDRVEEVVCLERVENKVMKVFGVRQGGMKAAEAMEIDMPFCRRRAAFRKFIAFGRSSH